MANLLGHTVGLKKNAYDFTVANFGTTGAWTSLDLSAKGVPVTATGVFIDMNIGTGGGTPTNNELAGFCTDGTSYQLSRVMQTTATVRATHNSGWIPIHTAQTIYYYRKNANVTAMNMTVTGYTK